MRTYQDKIILQNSGFSENATIYYTAELHTLESGLEYGVLIQAAMKIGMMEIDVYQDSEIRQSILNSDFLFETLEKAQAFDEETNEYYMEATA